MSMEEKQRIIAAWDTHSGGAERHRKFANFSSTAEEDFCEMFRNGIQAHANLTKKEKNEICIYAKL